MAITDVIAGKEPWWVEHGRCEDVMVDMPDACIDCIISDPPYPEIDRSYGRLTEAEWWDLMMSVCTQARRILKPTGSAVFILQPNSRKVGSMRGWLCEFMAWVCREWNMVQDVWWWNTSTLPVGGAISADLLRGSLKACIWIGREDCYRNQASVLWHESNRNMERRMNGESGRETYPSGRKINRANILAAAARRGGVTPFNVIPIANTDSQSSAGANGHGVGTPLDLCLWWTKYICPPNGLILDPFCGSGTSGIAARLQDRFFIGIEQDEKFSILSRERIGKTAPLCDAVVRNTASPTPPVRGLFDEQTDIHPGDPNP